MTENKKSPELEQLTLWQAQRKYDVIKVKGGWKITENGAILFGDPPTDECSAKVYAYIWNRWNGPYKRGEEARCRPLTDQESRDILATQLRLARLLDEE